jgi:arylsulfatase A-like enzyme/Tfp pilus assembly protein PilF
MQVLRYLCCALLLAQCLCLPATTPQKAAGSPRPNVVLITLDTTRVDRMGFLGSSRGLTPNLDNLSRQAAIFARAYAQVPLTTPSHATILTGTYPQFHHVNYMGDLLDAALPFLPDILHKNGYRTAAFVGGLVLDPKKLAQGFERGFDAYDAGFHRRGTGGDRYQSLERRGAEVVARALAWLNKPSAKPFFLWVHLYDPHDPYDPPEPFKSRYSTQPYDGDIAYTDFVVGKLLAALRARGLFDSTLIAVMADHGEAFGEHGEKHHGIFLYDETIHVPLLIKTPRQKSNEKIAARVGLVDVAPTILQAANLPVPGAMQGQSLLPFMNSGTKDKNSPRSVYSETGYGHLSFGWSKLQSWRTGNFLYIQAPERELYDESVDSSAAHNRASESKAVADTLAAQVADFFGRTTGGVSTQAVLDAEQAESLHALGYMTAENGTSNENETGADPKQGIAIANLLYDALVDMESERYEEAAPILEQVLQQEPNTPIAFLQLGRAYMSLKEYQKAVPPLQSLVKKKPDDAFARYELGCALVKTGNWEEAAPHFEAAVSQMPSSAMMHFYLALVYQRTSRMADAMKEFQSALHVNPNNFPANLLLGRMFVIQQKPTEALLYLRKAVKLRPDSIDVHGFLADAFRQLGDSGNAQRELAEADRLRSQGAPRLGTPTDESR